MGSSLIQRAFAGGELLPALHTRADLVKYHTGLRTCRNFVVRRHGGASYRPGFKFVAEAKAGGVPALFPFVFAAADSSYAIEAGSLYFRFHKNGSPVTVSSATAWSGATAYVVGDLASRLGVIYYCILAHTNQQPPNATYWYPFPIVNGANVYEIPTPYSGGDFFDPARACLAQSGMAITITHLNRAPMQLTLQTLTQPPRWVLTTITTGPSIAAPTGVGAAAGAVGTRELRYQVTAVKAETYEESDPSATATLAAAAEPTIDAPHVVTWTPVAGAVEYRIYADPFNNGTFGLLGVATGQAAFRDVNQVPDFSLTPPVARVLFASTNNYPAVATTYQQRRIFGGTHTDREQIFASQVGYFSNFAIRSPLQDDDAVTWTIASNRIQPVLHLVGLQVGLVVLTDSGEWAMRGDENGTLLPTAINPRQHGYVGSSFVPPAIIGESVLFVQTQGSIVRDLRFDEKVEGLSGRDLTIYATHLLEADPATATAARTIVDMAYAQNPDSVLWCVRSDGALLGLTYIRDEDVWGWHRHDTGLEDEDDPDGGFKRVCVVPESGEDYLYAVVEREIDGQTKRYIERLASRQFSEVKHAFLVDSGKTQTTLSPTTSVTGLSHLVGRSVVALVDGAVQGPFTVSASGTVTLTTSGRTVQIGLPIIGELETLSLDIQGSSLRDKRKVIKALGLLLENSVRGFSVGPSAAQLLVQRAEPWEGTGLVTGRQEMQLTGTFTEEGRVLIRQTNPAPLTVAGLIPHFEVGG